MKIQHRDSCSKFWEAMMTTMADHHLDYLNHKTSDLYMSYFKPCGICVGRFNLAKSTMTARVYRVSVQDEFRRVLGDNYDDVK